MCHCQNGYWMNCYLDPVSTPENEKFISHLWQGLAGGGVGFLGRESSRPNPFLQIIMAGNHLRATLFSATSCCRAILPQDNHVGQSSPQATSYLMVSPSPVLCSGQPDRSTSISRPPAEPSPHPNCSSNREQHLKSFFLQWYFYMFCLVSLNVMLISIWFYYLLCLYWLSKPVGGKYAWSRNYWHLLHSLHQQLYFITPAHFVASGKRAAYRVLDSTLMNQECKASVFV